MATTKAIKMDAATRQAKIDSLVQELAKFGKGERASKGAKKIRRSLRSLGYYISKVNAEAKADQELETTDEMTEELETA